MLFKFFEKHVEVDRSESDQKSKDRMELDYYLLESESDDSDTQGTKKCYGVEIIKRQNGFEDEKMQYKDIYSNRERAKKLIGLLAEQTVTPSSLSYVLDDLIGM
jgi:hypothetical protein